MTRLLTDGAESGNLSFFDVSQQGSNITSPVHSGLRAYGLNDFDTTGLTVSVPGNPTEIYTRQYIYWTNTPGDTPGNLRHVIRYLDHNGVVQCAVSVGNYTPIGKIQAYDDNAHVGILQESAGGVLVAGQYMLIETHIKFHASAGVFQIKVNGNMVVSFTGQTSWGGIAECGRVRFESANYDAHIDDFALNNTAGATDNSWIGPTAPVLPPPPPPPPDPGPVGGPTQDVAPTIRFGGTQELTGYDDLWWAIEDPGGFAEGGFRQQTKISQETPYTGFEDLVVSRGTKRVYEGRIEPVVRQSDAQGMWARYGTFGWQRHARDDDFYRGLFRDQRLDAWDYAGPESPPTDYKRRITWDVGDDPGLTTTDPCIRVICPQLETGETITAGDAFDLRKRIPPGWPRGSARRIYFQWRCLGSAAANARLRVYSAPDPDNGTSRTLLYDAAWTQADSLSEGEGVVDVQGSSTGGIPHRWFIIRPFYANGNITDIGGSSGRTIIIHNLAIYGTGTEVAAGGLLTGREVIRELALASCPALHVVGAPGIGGTVTADYISDMARLIEFCIAESPTQPSDLLDLMMNYVANPLTEEWTWGVYEKLSSGLYRLDVRPRSTTVDYYVHGVEISDLSRDANNLRNKAVVRYTDLLGRSAETVRTQTIPELTALNISRTTYVDMGTITAGADFIPATTRAESWVTRKRGGGASPALAAANLFGDVLLRKGKRRSRAGQFRVIGRQVTHVGSGSPISYLELTPEGGKLIHIADTGAAGPVTDPLNDDRVFRVRRVEVHTKTAEAILTVEQGSTNLDALLARLQAPGS